MGLTPVPLSPYLVSPMDCSCLVVLLTQRGLQAIPPIFSTAFSYERNIRSWEKVGAVPFTMNCLNDESVCIEIDDAQDDSLLAIEQKHKEAWKLLQR